ncbi:Atrial natriuretic peptide-converting enzyme [Collichthys lucidus]|uniref:Atrial natriuretic peptide-converting enzyme n=1 Tax=Collichthys lucidus TaxID=240159 RepID=A0A4U5VY40_COLLU|nr:Atrial natriuretic peptide-converting enzyme [Collichthys lucidus]
METLRGHPGRAEPGQAGPGWTALSRYKQPEREGGWFRLDLCEAFETRRPEVGMGGETCPHKLGSTNHLRLLLYILIPTQPPGLQPLPSPEPVADSDPSYHSNSTNPSSFFEMVNVTVSPQNRVHRDDHKGDDVTSGHDHSTPAATTSTSTASSQAPPTQPYTSTPPDWLTSVASLSTAWPIGTTAAPDSAASKLTGKASLTLSLSAGSCQLIAEPQCHMLPYNQTWLSSSVAVVKSSEVDMLLRFFSYLSRLSCYRHIMLFGCSLALPECVAADKMHSRRVVLPCASFCEAAREGCEPVLQMFNASWPEFLRCSQFSNTTAATLPAPSSSSPTATASPAPYTCYTPRQVKGKPSVCGGKDHFLCTTGICVPQKLVIDWTAELLELFVTEMVVVMATSKSP